MIKIRFILFNFLKLFLISMILLIILFLIVQLLEDIPDILSGKKVFVLQNYLFSIPNIFVQISPLVTLLSSMFLVSEMLKNNEIKIFEISGINLLKPFSVFLLAGFIISIFCFITKNFIVPKTIKENLINKPISFSSSKILFSSEKYRSNNKFKNIEVSLINENKNIISVKAKEGIYLGENVWLLKDGVFFILDKNGTLQASQQFISKSMELPLDTEILVTSMKNPDSLKLPQLLQIINKFKRLNINPYLYKVYLYEKFSYPFLNFFILFVVFPFFNFKQKLSRFFVLSSTIIVGFLSYGIYSIFVTLSKEGKLLPFAGCSGLHFILLAFFISFISKTDTIPFKIKRLKET